MSPQLIKAIAVVAIMLIVFVYKAVKGIREAMEAERRRCEQGDANAPMAAGQQGKNNYNADADQIKGFLKEMGLRSQDGQAVHPQQPQPRPQPQPQRQQPQRQPTQQEESEEQEHRHRGTQQDTHGARQQVDQQAATEAQQRPGKAPAKKAKVGPTPQEPDTAGRAGKGTGDPMSIPALRRLSPAQRAIVLADILGQPKATRRDDDITSRW